MKRLFQDLGWQIDKPKLVCLISIILIEWIVSNWYFELRADLGREEINQGQETEKKGKPKRV